MRSGERSTAERVRAGAATLLVHAALILLLLRTGPAAISPADESSALTLFDVSEPVPPPPLPQPAVEQPPAKQPPRRAAPNPRRAGGSPAPAPAQRTIIAAAPPVERMDATSIIDAPPLPIAASALGTDGTGDATSGNGAGRGRGTGSGIGDGSGLDGGRPQRFRRAEWIRKPTQREMLSYWPAEAIRRKVSGRAYLACILRKPGRPDRCISILETPRGYGFGEAAVRLSPLFLIRPVRIEDEVADLPVIVPVTFQSSR